MKKRILSWALVLCMVLTLLPSAAFAVDVIASGACGAEGDHVTWTLDSDGVLTISGEGNIADYTWYGGFSDSPFSGTEQSRSIKSIVIEDGVTSIGAYVFVQCASVEHILIPDSVTQIGTGAFIQCESLRSINLPDGIISIPDKAFHGCSSLERIVIPDSVHSIGDNAFMSCHSLQEIQLPDSIETIGLDILYNTAYDQNEANWSGNALYVDNYLINVRYGVEQIELDANVRCVADGAFAGTLYYPNLTSIIVSPDNPYFTEYDGVLYSKDMKKLVACPSKKSESFSVPEGVTSIGNHAFACSQDLNWISLPASLEDIGNSAFFMSGISHISIPEGITIITDLAFCDCISLKSVTLPKTITEIGGSAFSGCRNLECINIPDGVTCIADGAFSGCSSLASISVSEDAVPLSENDANIEIPSNVAYLGEGAFFGCSTFANTITIPEATTSIGNYVLSNCSNLTSIIVSEENTNYVTEDGVLFNKDKTELISFPAGKTGSYAIPDSVTSINKQAFYGCKLTGIIIPESVTNIGESAFWECSNLISVCYGGSAEQWPYIEFGEFNDPLTGANIYYNHSSDQIDPTTVFTDVSHDWAYPGIEYCYNHGLIVGTSETTFSPEEALTRGQFVAILWRQLGCPAPKGENPFTDLTQDYYKDAITWAAENKVVYGRSATTFDPDCAITRQELTTMFYRYVGGYLKQDVSGAADISTFPDYSSVADYAQAAMAWAKGVGLITGNKIGGTIYLDPLGAATRAQAATMFMNLCEKVLK